MSNTTPPVTTAIVLVAGIGSRLRPHTDTTPKCLLTVGDQPLLFRFLRQLKAHGIREVYLITGFKSETIEESVANLTGVPDLILIENRDYKSLGNVQSLKLGFQAVVNKGELDDNSSIIVADGDILIESSMILSKLTTSDSPDIFVIENRVATEEVNEKYLRLSRNESGHVEAIGKNLPYNPNDANLIGIGRFSGTTIRYYLSAIDQLSKEELVSTYYDEVFARSKERLHLFDIIEVPEGSFIEIDTEKDLDAARAMAELWD